MALKRIISMFSLHTKSQIDLWIFNTVKRNKPQTPSCVNNPTLRNAIILKPKILPISLCVSVCIYSFLFKPKYVFQWEELR